LKYSPDLTVDCGSHDEGNKVNDNNYKCGETDSRVNPYRPPVGTMSFDDIPLVVEMGEELPDVEAAHSA